MGHTFTNNQDGDYGNGHYNQNNDCENPYKYVDDGGGDDDDDDAVMMMAPRHRLTSLVQLFERPQERKPEEILIIRSS